MDYKPEPTVIPFSDFNASEDAATLRSAMKGLGTDEAIIISILTSRSNKQRQEMTNAFTAEYERDLLDDLKSELGGKFEDVIVALMMLPDQYLCKQLRKAMDGIGTEEQALIEILCPMSNEQVQALIPCYEEMYGRPLAEQLCGETSGHFRRLLTLILTGARDPVGTVDPEKAKEDAQRLYDAGEEKFGTDENVFYRILAHASFAQLRLIFEEYKDISGMTIEQALKHELSGEMYEAMSAIVECVQSTAAFFANRLHRAMNGAGTDDTTLIRIIVSRSEIDMNNIKDEYERIYNRTLVSAIKNETSGDYNAVLCALIGEA